MRAHLFIRSGHNSGEAYEVAGEALIVGRDGACEVPLNDRHVSRQHFRIEQRGDDHWLVDLGSRNGTAVNGVPTKERRLACGDEIRAGSTHMVFLSGVEARLPEPAGPIGRSQTVDMDSQQYDMIGMSPAMQKVFMLISKVAPLDVTVLVTGESGTGKEMVAQAIHRNSARSAGPLATVNCAAIPTGLVESELFGHEKGAFTGAHAQRRGRFEAASGGTLFLDEVGELPPDSQAKLLRVLEERKITRVGGEKPIDVNVRLVSASNRDLEALAAAGQFREDLLYRLEVVHIHLPPLRERRDDIRLLVGRFLEANRQKLGRRVLSVSPEAFERLLSYAWPGNIRELRNVIERAAIMAAGPAISAADILLPEAKAAADATEGQTVEMSLSLAELERQHIMNVLASVRGNKAEAARILGISRSTLFVKLKSYGSVEDTQF